MKKKVTNPDGSVVEYEGTVEELAELEKTITSKPSRKDENKSKKRILNEDLLQAIKDLSQQIQLNYPPIIIQHEELQPYYYPYQVTYTSDSLQYCNNERS